MSRTNQTKHISVTREGLARKTAREYVAALLLDEGLHADAFERGELTETERSIAHDEIKRIGIEMMVQYKCDL